MVTKTVSYEESYFARNPAKAVVLLVTFISALSQKDRDRRIQIEFHVANTPFSMGLKGFFVFLLAT
jgi:hypothetical protein